MMHYLVAYVSKRGKDGSDMGEHTYLLAESPHAEDVRVHEQHNPLSDFVLSLSADNEFDQYVSRTMTGYEWVSEFPREATDLMLVEYEEY